MASSEEAGLGSPKDVLSNMSPEARKEAYNKLLVASSPILVFQESASRPIEFFVPGKPTQWPALPLAKCREYDEQETNAVFYGSNHFNLVDTTTRRETSILQAFLVSPTPAHARLLSHMSLSFPGLEAIQGRPEALGLSQDGEYLLPKGRKDLDEPLEQTAQRETFEETGIRVRLLPVNIDTLATLPSSIKAKDRPTGVTEPIAVTQRFNTKNILKIIFWYVAAGDSTTAREEGTQQENEEFDTVWVGFDNVNSTLSFEDDRGIVEAAIAAVCRGVPQTS
ncbi:hypothetical protein CEP54_010211 [Fusarium duplospermum]|uniref:Nudix hydrolase domain-containing protein n=1 Tax=Fusarium duplospermum TaxID=1325734 RepID=A0A428PLA6_9HYPO|nr:hypothetical protein CEP54_010211 [Fusarium duplospermum]